MNVVIIYESMYGNTHEVAERIGAAARERGEVELIAVSHASTQVVDSADLVFVGGPTHMHGMSSEKTRQMAVSDAEKHEGHDLDPDAEGPGLRNWFERLGNVDGTAAVAFDTRLDGPSVFTGRASRGIGRRLRHHGFREIAEPESFLVDKDNSLIDGEANRATQWTLALLDQLADEPSRRAAVDDS